MQKFLKKYLSEKDLIFSLQKLVQGSKNSVKSYIVLERLEIEGRWIKEIERHFYSLENIAFNPKSFITPEERVVNIERAKKINANSVKYLSQNTHQINNIDNDGNVQPKMILTTEYEEQLDLYENRFVITVVKKLNEFLLNKMIEIKKRNFNYDLRQIDYNTNLNYLGNDINLNLSVEIRKNFSNDEIEQKNQELLKILDNMINRLTILRATPFYKALCNTRAIMAPIQQTNLLRSNPDYNNAYKIYMFLSGFKVDGYKVSLEKKNGIVEDDLKEDLIDLASINIGAIMKNIILKDQSVAETKKNSVKLNRQSIRRKFETQINFDNMDDSDGENIINEYLFYKMQEILGQDAVVQKSPVSTKKELIASFSRLYSSMENVTNQIYENFFEPEKGLVHLSGKDVSTMEQKLKMEKESLERSKIYLKLREKDLLKLKRQQKMSKKKIDRIKVQIAEQKKIDAEKRKKIAMRKIAKLNEDKRTTNSIRKKENGIRIKIKWGKFKTIKLR